MAWEGIKRMLGWRRKLPPPIEAEERIRLAEARRRVELLDLKADAMIRPPVNRSGR